MSGAGNFFFAASFAFELFVSLFFTLFAESLFFALFAACFADVELQKTYVYDNTVEKLSLLYLSQRFSNAENKENIVLLNYNASFVLSKHLLNVSHFSFLSV